MATAKEQAKKLIEERGVVQEQMNTIHLRADEHGNLSADDQKKWDDLSKRDDELKAQAERVVRMAEFQDEAAKRAAENLRAPNKEEKTKEQGNEEYRASYGRYLRAHKEQKVSSADMDVLQKRGTSDQVGSTDSLGGYLIPEGFSNMLERYMTLYGGMLEAADTFTTATGNPFPWPTVNDTGSTGAYIDQAAADTVGDVTFASVAFPLVPTMTSKVVKVSWELLQDSFFNLDGLLAELLGERLGRFSNTEFTTGSTAGKISGFITGSTSGKTAASATAFTRAELVDLMHSVDPAYRNSPKARWMFNDTTLAALKKLSFGSGDDRPLWVPGMALGAPDTLEGKPYSINQDMATAATTTKPIAFGDFGKYKIRIAKGITLEVTRDRYWDERVNGYVAICRMDGRLVNTSAIKFLTMA